MIRIFNSAVPGERTLFPIAGPFEASCEQLLRFFGF